MFGFEQLPRSLDAALRDVTNDKERVRVSALADLARHADEAGERGTAAMVAALRGDKSPEVRAAAAVALADAGAKDAVDAVLEATSDANVRVRQMALIALGELGDGKNPRVASVVRAAVSDVNAAIRYQALIAMNALALPFADEALVHAASDADEEVRHVSLRLLEERAPEQGARIQPSDATVRAAVDRLADASLRVRLAAALLLGHAGDRRGVRIIVEAVEALGGPLDADDEQAAIVLAGELAVRDAVPGLARRAFRPFGRARDFAYDARIALAKMGDVRAKAAILKGLSAFTRDARTHAAVAAARAHLMEALPRLEEMQSDERRADPAAVREAIVSLKGNVAS
ncbi:MAG TPA: HEAT repeat domain-containing protein [Polyangiaceae bacterium]|nr:HEAT repeat domain-containing protein [Polyangiaceae bacterium]